MAQMDFNNKNMQEYDELYKNFYSQVEALPMEQRANKSISIADTLINDYKSKKEQIKKEQKEQREIKKKEEEKKKNESSSYGTFMNMLENKWKSGTQVWEDFE